MAPTLRARKRPDDAPDATDLAPAVGGEKPADAAVDLETADEVIVLEEAEVDRDGGPTTGGARPMTPAPQTGGIR